jgi:co-chaperonin GroES (HSP10)
MDYSVVGWRILVKPNDLDEILQENVPEFLKDKNFKVALPPQMERMVESSTVMGTIISIGDWAFKAYFRKLKDNEEFQCPVSIGDRITYARHSGEPWIDPDTKEKYVLLNDEDIHLVKKQKGITQNG